MNGYIDKTAIALEINPKTYTAPIVEQGDTLTMLADLLQTIAPIISELDRSCRPAEPERGSPGQFFYTPAHEPHVLTNDEKRLIAVVEMAKEVHLHATINDPRYTHCRTRGDRWPYTYIYHRDPTSPSGVINVAAGPADKVDPLIRRYRNNSPLSPTEGLRGAA